ncbi:MAG: ribose 5-phosphate isomerase B [Cyclobacteriaceae bacterium]|nr:ribose 5-phosphate isomerase B [Cyclobacteriaceae bacterium]
MKIAIAGDHAGFEYKEKLIEHLKSMQHDVTDFGPFSADSVDYPDFVHPASRAVESGMADFGILICGSGNGVAITANKHAAIRAALCWNQDLASLARQHNDANVLCIPARFIPFDLTVEMSDIFLSTEFEGGRHKTRVDKISCS